MNKKIYTLSEAESQYMAEQEQNKIRNIKEQDEYNAEILSVWEDRGFEPEGTDGLGVVVFMHKGRGVKFQTNKDSGYWYIRRVKKCLICKNERYTMDKSFSPGFAISSVGELLKNPIWEYHACDHPETPVQKFTRFVLKLLRVPLDE